MVRSRRSGSGHVRSYLESNEGFGKRFGRLSLDCVPLADSVVGVFAPSDHEPERLMEFERGGVLPRRAPDASAAEVPPNRQAVDPDHIDALAAATKAIIIGVWDDEGLLFCEPVSLAGCAVAVRAAASHATSPAALRFSSHAAVAG